MIDRSSILRAIETLLEAAPRGSLVVLFGSHARGDAGPDSDLDFLVIEPSVPDRRTETARLRSALRSLRLPVDLIVVSRHAYDAWKDLPNNVINRAAREGQTHARAA